MFAGSTSLPNQNQMLALIMLLLQQLMQQLNQQTQPTDPTPTPNSNETINLNSSEQNILDDTFGNGENQVLVRDGGNQDGKLSVGDTLVVQDQNGQEIKKTTLSTDDIYALRFRENMIKNGQSIGTGWEFSEQLVSIKNSSLTQAELRPYVAPTGQFGVEKVVERNQFWEVVERDGDRFLLMRRSNDQQQTIFVSDALNDIFQHRENYAFDCASPMALLNLKSSLDTIGADDFNQHAGQLMLASWFDQYDQSKFDGGYISTVRTAQAGEITINGIHNLAGETALFDPNKGDKLIPGNTYYFDLPGDNSSAVQGWNALYLGQNAEGAHDFWSNSIGQITVNFNSDSYLTTGQLSGYYLGAVVSAPNTNRLEQWDNDQSGLG